MTSGQNPAQAAIDADVQQIGTDFTTLAGIFNDLQALVATANGNGTPVDTSALDSLVAQGASVLQNYQGLLPNQPAPDPTPTPDPTPVDPDSGN